jgi:hypothetical protein
MANRHLVQMNSSMSESIGELLANASNESTGMETSRQGWIGLRGQYVHGGLLA